uniref:Uncharacterized protein n=1 Tax=Rhizophora mucronata TaxID=61149 RepID=A0A2P2QW64_RHIMU
MFSKQNHRNWIKKKVN